VLPPGWHVVQQKACIEVGAAGAPTWLLLLLLLLLLLSCFLLQTAAGDCKVHAEAFVAIWQAEVTHGSK
jgi:hypothetical protein